MARIYPRTPDEDAPNSEKRVHQALERQLPADWIVLHGRRFNLPGKGSDLSKEGEIDFVVLDPARGWLGLEVKGGRIERKDEKWISINRHGVANPIKDPAKQATSAVHHVGGYIKGLPWFRKHKVSPTFGWAVVFPDVHIDGRSSLDLPRELMIDHDGLADIASCVERAFTFYNLNGPPLGQEAQNAFVRALCSSFQLVPAMSSQLDKQQQALVRLTEEQMASLEMLEHNNRVAISGSAGTGKTMLAMEKARRLAEAGQRVLLLCFNRQLADYLATQAEGFTVSSFHAFAKEWAGSAGLPFNVPEDPAKTEAFWDEEAAEILMKALDIYPDERFDAVIVDEGQDFQEYWWTAVHALLRDPNEGTLYVFYDPNQNIFHGVPIKELGLLGTAPLIYNCRNTTSIAQFSASIIDTEARVKLGAPEGAAVDEITVANDQAMVDAVRKQLHRLLVEHQIATDRLVVMSPRTNTSPVWRAKKLGNFTLVARDKVPGPSEVRFVSLRAFKGLEADAVVLCDIKEGSSSCKPSDLYVATSRARHILVVIRHAD